MLSPGQLPPAWRSRALASVGVSLRSQVSFFSCSHQLRVQRSMSRPAFHDCCQLDKQRPRLLLSGAEARLRCSVLSARLQPVGVKQRISCFTSRLS